MKKFNTFIYVLALALAFQSCSKDDDNNDGGGPTGGPTSGTNLTADNSASEELPVSISKLNSGIAIEGASINAGAPPAPTAALDVNVNSSDVIGAQNGFKLNFNSTENVAGVYIQFKDKSGTNADSYYDVPVANLTGGSGGFGKVEKIASKLSVKGAMKSNVEDLYTLNVNLINDFPPGQFCATFCIYDSAGQVSQATDVCVEVEAWGGSGAFVGEWSIPEDTDEEVWNETVFCESGSSFEAPSDKDSVGTSSIKFNADGTFTFYMNESYKELDWDASYASCTPVYVSVIENYALTGKWAYNEDDQSLILVMFAISATTTENGQTQTATLSYPNGEFFFDSSTDDTKIKVEGSNLIITETYDGITETTTLTRK